MPIDKLKLQLNWCFRTFVLTCWCAIAATSAPLAHAQEIVVHKSSNDNRDYRVIYLENQLEVLLISDPTTDKAAAAMDVRVGNGADPKQRQGLAHFLEHMLFLGTEKYPQPDEYQNYLNQHGGSHNAYTSLEHTNYFFDINPNYLQPMLDRFAQFFIAPSFDAEYVDRERVAVHSEYAARIKDDNRRALDVYREVLNPEHPMATFGVGNLTTLDNADGESLRNDLLSFYRQHYFSANMKLVVLGRESLDELQQWVVPLFANIPKRVHDASESNSDVTNAVTVDGLWQASNRKQIPLFAAKQLPLKLQIKPQREQRDLKLLFPIPSTNSYYREKPTDYLANLLGDEGKGSLFAALKARGWAEALFAGTYFDNSDESFFQVNIRLTAAGLERASQVVELTFATIDLIREQGVDGWRFDELKQLNNIAFRFEEKSAPISTVSDLAANLHYFPPQDVLWGPYRMDDYDPQLIRRFLQQLKRSNLLLVVMVPEVETDTSSEFYQTPYKLENLKTGKVPMDKTLVTELKLPPANEFIPKNLSLKSKHLKSETKSTAVELALNTSPELIKDASRMRVWFKLDDQFKVPRAATYLRIKSPVVAESVRGAVLMELYAALIRDSLNEFAYPASLAGLQYSITANNRGLDLNIGGYNDGQDVLFQRIVAEMRNPRFQSDRFALIKEELKLSWQNVTTQPPYVQLLGYLPTLLLQPLWTEDKKLQTLDAISVDDANRFAKQVFVDAQADMLLHGNITRQEAIKTAALVEIDLLGSISDKKIAATKVLKIANDNQAALATFPVDHNDTVVSLYIQGRDDSIAEQARILLLNQVINAPFFHQLRTERQLGYVVFAGPFNLKSVPALQLLVQSPSASAAELVEEMAAFNARFVAQLPLDLSLHKQALITQLQERPKNLAEQSAEFWENILAEQYDFDLNERLVNAINDFDDAEFNAYLSESLSTQSRRLWLTSKPIDLAVSQDKTIAQEEKLAEEKIQETAVPTAEAQEEEIDQSSEETSDSEKPLTSNSALQSIQAVSSWEEYWNGHEKFEFP